MILLFIIGIDVISIVSASANLILNSFSTAIINS
ncbi:uncharacterized protein METZ01_LOCUS247757 [marine metagenome]|uniref:Uncharacterized protein n=1 Tax=marine metagenome TaxID=408172 RepID=A0A382I7P4_9ZZZZ